MVKYHNESAKGTLVQETKSPNKAVVSLIVIALLAAVAAGSMYILNSRSEASSSVSTTSLVANSAVASSNQTTTAAATSATYTDGTYTSTGRYATPESSESIDLTVTIANNTITGASIHNSGNAGESRDYQQRFAHNCTSLVVGKNINAVSLSRVAGSSLTSTGFNTALDQIKADAAA